MEGKDTGTHQDIYAKGFQGTEGKYLMKGLSVDISSQVREEKWFQKERFQDQEPAFKE